MSTNPKNAEPFKSLELKGKYNALAPHKLEHDIKNLLINLTV